MPAKDQYGSQPPIELLRQWMDHGGWYDRKALEFKSIIDIGKLKILIFGGKIGGMWKFLRKLPEDLD